MKYVKKIFTMVLVILTLNLYLPKMAFTQQQFASADVPKHEPRIWSTPEKDIPTLKEKKTSGWTWAILVALIGGAAAAAAASGGEDSGGDGSGGGDNGSDTGSYTGTW